MINYLFIKRSFLIFFVTFLVHTTNTYAQTLTTSNLPIILINTEGQTINDEPGIVCSMSIVNNASSSNQVTDPANEYNGKIKIEYRGCSSQSYPKKPFGIELRSTTAVTSSIDAPLFGLPEESDWILNPSYIDKSFMRDVLAYYMANASGRYASRTRYVEVLINGQYQGIYIFQEKIKRDAGRVNINKLDPTDLGSNSITGGYIVKVDKTCGNFDPTHRWASSYSSPGGTQPHYWLTDYPNDDNIVPAQFTYIKNYMSAFETTMASSTYCTGYSTYIDDNTFVDYFLMEELASNPDAYRFSTYFAKERASKGGKLSAGPVWDFNLGFGFLTDPFSGNANSYEGWRYTAPGDPSFPVPFWWAKLLACCQFNTKFAARYHQLRQTVWSTPTLTAFIDNQYALLNQGAFARNFQKWPIIGVPTWTDQTSYNGATLVDEFTYLKSWLTNRLAWMDSHIDAFVQEPIATLSGTNPVKKIGEPASLTLAFTGTAPWSYSLSSGQSGTAISSPTSVSVQPNVTTTYSLNSVANTCGTGLVSGTVVVTVLPPSADLSTSLVSNRRIAAPGDTVTMSLFLTNTGPQTAYAIQLQNRLPTGMTFTGSSLSSVSNQSDVVTISVDSLKAGQTAIFPYRVKATTNGLFWNAAQVTATSTSDPDSQPGSGTGDGQDDMALADVRVGDSNGNSSVSSNPNQVPLPSVQSSQPATDPTKADINLSLVASSMVFEPNGIVSLTLAAMNRGGAAATNVTLQCVLPSNWTLTNPDGFTLTGQTITGPPLSISSAQTAYVVLAVKPTSTGLIRAQVLTSSNSDPDSIPGNGFTKGEDDEASLLLRIK